MSVAARSILPPKLIPSKASDHRHWGHLKGSALAFAITEAVNQFPGVTVVIAANSNEAVRLEKEISFFLGCGNSADERSKLLLSLPDWETLPYDTFSPHQDIVSERLASLYRLPTLQQGILVVSLATLMHRLPPKSFLEGYSLVLDISEKFDIDSTRMRLQSCGYRCVDTVFEHGEFAVRGSIIDIFPMGSNEPYRIELFDDEIETLRTFDPESQRSKNRVEQIRVLPAKEFPLTPEAIRLFKDQWLDRFDVNPRGCPVYQDVAEGISSAGIEYFMPLFFEHTETLFDYLPSNTLLINTPGLADATDRYWREVNKRYEDRRHDISHPILPPKTIFLEVDEVHGQFKKFPRVTVSEESLSDQAGHVNIAALQPPKLPVNHKADNPLAALQSYLQEKQDSQHRVLFCAESAGRRESLIELLQRINVRPQSVDNWQDFLNSEVTIAITVATLESGLELEECSYSLIAEPQLFGSRVLQERRRRKSSDEHAENIVKNLTELSIGAPIVHIDHGVGRYLGLQTLAIDEQEQEFLTLEYAKGAKLYVPVSSLHLIARYSGANDESAPTHQLGTELWQKEKRNAAEQIRDVAAELLNIYARRAAKEGYIYKIAKEEYDQFSADFPFEETPDQEAAIEHVIMDMKSNKPMDRLICGDVGFGKTEVAMRAAFIAVQDNKQVGILVPTTLLAQQHYDSFNDRFADWPINIEVLSRFKSPKEQQVAIRKLNEGTIDIIIGTHKLLSSAIKFKRLGLIIVDEEHRFGVRHKEQLKSLRSDVDILTLTATPIPRTLNMAMSGIRDMSIIATPPAKRLSIKTFVRRSNDAVIKEAILRELMRGGQIYYLHNEVKTIDKTAHDLEELVPEIRLGIAHGQMRERELEQVMSDFYHKRYNVLVCTTIIETGIDVPTANTIIMDRADRLGLAQLHQLRGRVGRSHHQAYAYLLTPHRKSMTKDATKRLDAIQEASELGAGFTLASHDLEIRGAGELLGDEQSGNMHSLGFSLYMEMLDSAVKAIKEGKTPDLDKPLHQGPEINLHIPALIPDEYLPDVHNRLIMYKRIASAKDDKQLYELKIEMIDRFGLLPDQVKNLFRVTELKLKAVEVGLTKIDAGSESGYLQFGSEAKVDPLTIVKMVQSQPQLYKLEGADKLKFILDMADAEIRVETIEGLITQLKGQ
ncbi:MAG: transcription-repair coupling factor [Pseudomonadales bacterium]|nr:transcription-repair coupling factor [Pseudomonadales bacterium]